MPHRGTSRHTTAPYDYEAARARTAGVQLQEKLAARTAELARQEAERGAVAAERTTLRGEVERSRRDAAEAEA